MAPLKILMVSDFYPPFLGGVEVLVSSLSAELVERGHAVSVATLAAPGTVREDTENGVRIHRIRTTVQRADGLFSNAVRPWAPPAPDPEAVVALRRIVADEQPDVVHGHDWLARSFLPLKRARGPRLVMSLHYFTLSCAKKTLMYEGAPCTGPELLKCLGCAKRHYGSTKGSAVAFGQWLASRAEARLVDLFLPVSYSTAVGNDLPGSGLPFQVVPNLVRPPADPSPFGHLLTSLPKGPFLLFVGDIRRDKGVHVLLNAYTALTNPPPLVLLGKVWPETPNDLPTGVTILRDWPNPAVREAMRRSLLLIAPSVWPEPFGMVVTEALAAGRPVVASAIGGIPEIVREGVEGLLVRPGDAQALTAALERMLNDKELRDTLAVKAERRAQRYMPDAVVPLVEDAYERVVHGPQPGL